jgi:hypothetical protein
MLARTNCFRQSVLEKYQKRISRLRKALQEGKFSRYAAAKKRMLLLSLLRYRSCIAFAGASCVGSDAPACWE